MKHKLRCVKFAGLVLAVSIAAASATTYRLRSGVMGAGGAPASNAQWSANSTLGQPTPIGEGTSPGGEVEAGFWGTVVALTPTGVEVVPEPPANRLDQNYPNPFNPATTIRYSVAQAGDVNITIFNVRGQRVKQLVDRHRAPGRYAATWEGVNDTGQTVASGVYFYRIQIGSFSDVKKMVILK
jgi:hypothetical protein